MVSSKAGDLLGSVTPLTLPSSSNAPQPQPRTLPDSLVTSPTPSAARPTAVAASSPRPPTPAVAAAASEIVSAVKAAIAASASREGADTLDLSTKTLTKSDVEYLCQALKKDESAKLTRLDLSQCTLDSAALSALKELPPSIGHVSLARNKLTRLGAIDIDLPHVVELILSGNALGDDGLKRLNIKAPKLEKINLSYNGLTEYSSAQINQLAGSLKSLVMVGNKLGYEGLERLSLPLCVCLDLSKNGINGPWRGAIGQKLPEVAELTLANNGITGTAANMTLTKVARLDLQRNKLTGFGPINLPELQELNLNANKLEQSLHGLHLPRLRVLSVDSNYLTTLGISGCPLGIKISAYHNQITSTEEAIFRQAKWVDLRFNKLGKQGLNLPNAEHVNASSNKLGDSGIAASRMPKALEVVCRDSQITGKDIGKFLNKAPRLLRLDLSFNPLKVLLPTRTGLTIQSVLLSDLDEKK